MSFKKQFDTPQMYVIDNALIRRAQSLYPHIADRIKEVIEAETKFDVRKSPEMVTEILFELFKPELKKYDIGCLYFVRGHKKDIETVLNKIKKRTPFLLDFIENLDKHNGVSYLYINPCLGSEILAQFSMFLTSNGYELQSDSAEYETKAEVIEDKNPKKIVSFMDFHNSEYLESFQQENDIEVIKIESINDVVRLFYTKTINQ